jgi:hypothetical protein
LLLIVTLLTSARCLKPFAAFCVPALHNDEAELVQAEASAYRIPKSDTVGAKCVNGFDQKKAALLLPNKNANNAL